MASAAAAEGDFANASGMMRNHWRCLYFGDHGEFAVAIGMVAVAAAAAESVKDEASEKNRKAR